MSPISCFLCVCDLVVVQESKSDSLKVRGGELGVDGGHANVIYSAPTISQHISYSCLDPCSLMYCLH